jgi:hypothetical protein
MQSFFKHLFSGNQEDSALSRLRLFCAPFIVAGILFFPWPHDPNDRYPVALLWTTSGLFAAANVMAQNNPTTSAILRGFAWVGGLVGLIWLFVV